jgi:hypothetical protein
MVYQYLSYYQKPDTSNSHRGKLLFIYTIVPELGLNRYNGTQIQTEKLKNTKFNHLYKGVQTVFLNLISVYKRTSGLHALRTYSLRKGKNRKKEEKKKSRIIKEKSKKKTKQKCRSPAGSQDELLRARSLGVDRLSRK